MKIPRRKKLLPSHRVRLPSVAAELSDAENRKGMRQARRVIRVESGGPPARKTSLSEHLDPELPTYRRFDAGGLPIYQTDVPEAAFERFFTCFATANPIQQLGAELAGMDIVVFGEKGGPSGQKWNPGFTPMPEMSDRAKYMQKLVDRWHMPETFLAMSPWALPLQVLFWNLMWKFEKNLGFVCDFESGLRLPHHAGGRLFLSPKMDKIVKRRNYDSGFGKKDEEAYTLDNWLVLRPNGANSPVGNDWLAKRFYKYEGDYTDVEYNAAKRAKFHGLPITLIKYALESLDPDKQDSTGDAMATEAKDIKGGQTVAIGDKNILDYMEPKGDGGKYLNERETKIENKAQRDVNYTALLSNTAASGPTGSSNQARVTFNAAATAYASYVAHVLDHALRRNTEINEAKFGDDVPPLNDKELEPFVMLVPRGMRAEALSPVKQPAPTGPGADQVNVKDGDEPKKKRLPEGTRERAPEMERSK